jgi:hypothetical protein
LSPLWKTDVVAKLDLHAQAVRRQLPLLDEVRDKAQLRVLIERLVEHRLENRLCIRREALVGVPGRNVSGPADGHVVGGRQGAPGADARCQQLQKRAASQVKRHDGLPGVGGRKLCFLVYIIVWHYTPDH